VKIDPLLASKIVWLDAFITNIDRTFRNTNLLMWHKELWIIDNGASFIFIIHGRILMLQQKHLSNM
jgi:hypothetical protein